MITLLFISSPFALSVFPSPSSLLFFPSSYFVFEERHPIESTVISLEFVCHERRGEVGRD